MTQFLKAHIFENFDIIKNKIKNQTMWPFVLIT